MHRAVINLLEKKGLLERVKGLLTLQEGFRKGSGRVQEGFKNPSGRVKDKEKDIVSNIPDKERLPEKEKPTKEKEVCKVEGNPESFEMLWERYPNKDGKKEALRHFCASVKSEKDLADIKRALENYIGSKNVREGYVKSGATWFNNWRDWIDFAGVGKKVAPELVKFDEDTEFLCADCRQVKPKTEREYGEDSRARCKVCHKKYLEEWNRQHANDMKRLQENWQKLSKHAKQYQVEHRQKLGLPILPWMKEG